MAAIPSDTADKPRYRSRNRLDNVLEWGAACVFAAALIGTWITTKSIWLAIVVTAVVTAILVWGIVGVQRIK